MSGTPLGRNHMGGTMPTWGIQGAGNARGGNQVAKPGEGRDVLPYWRYICTAHHGCRTVCRELLVCPHEGLTQCLLHYGGGQAHGGAQCSDGDAGFGARAAAPVAAVLHHQVRGHAPLGRGSLCREEQELAGNISGGGNINSLAPPLFLLCPARRAHQLPCLLIQHLHVGNSAAPAAGLH